MPMQAALTRIAGSRFSVLETWSGGQALTAAVLDRSSGLRRVLKVFAPGEDLHEASLLASIVHPRVPRILELGTDPEGVPFLLREHAEGTPLSEDLPLSAPETIELAAQLLEILAYVHLRGVLHLDLKPANVLRGGSRNAPEYVLLDFGLGAREGSAASGGTPFFAAPEVLLGLVPDQRSDLFSLGAMLVAALRGGTRSLPLARFTASFPREDFFSSLGEPAALLPESLRGFVERLVARAPQDRFPDAQAALDALRGTGSGRPFVQQLSPDPIACYGQAVDLAFAAGHQTLRIRGGDPSDQRALALHAGAEFGARADVRGGVTVLSRGATAKKPYDLELPPLTERAVAAHLERVASLSPEAASHTALALSAEGPWWPSRLGKRLEELVEAGAIVPNGPRWVWPNAEALRPLSARTQALAASPEAIRAAARVGLYESAQKAFLRGVAQDKSKEQELRQALTQGLLEAGEPGRALPLAHDLPFLRARALIDLGRLHEAEQLRRLAEAGATPREQRQLALALAFGSGDLACAEPIARELCSAQGHATDRLALASVLALRGETRQAEELLLAGLAGARTEHPHLAGIALVNLAEIRRGRGDLDAAREAAQEAITIFHRLGHVRHVATATKNLGVIQKDVGDLDAALTSQRRALGLFEHIGDRRGAAVTRANLGIVSQARGDTATAVRELLAAERELLQLGATDVLPRLRELLAQARAAAPKAEVRDDAATMPESPSAGGVPREVFRTFLAINRRLAGEASLDRAMRSLLEAAINLTGGRNGYLLVAGQDGIKLEFRTGDDDAAVVAFSRSLVNRALQQRTTLTSADAMLDKQLAEMPSVRELRARSAVCVPFRSASGVEGALYVDHPGRAGVFGPNEKEHLEVLGDQAAIAVDRMLHEASMAKELAESRRELAVARRTLRSGATKLIGKSKPMIELARQIEKVAQSDLAVLIVGATGTGKELVARRLHELSPRGRAPFVSENCSAIPAELMESELFGHAKGAFTGADQDRPGLLELASGGTLFLDEVGDMPSQLQPKLLRALQEGSIRRVGGKETIPVDLRLIAATHKDLKKMIAEGTFREDLFFRIAAVQIRVPPLRERGSDIVMLAEEFLARLNKRHARKVALADRAKAALLAYPWPGNVRELEHVIARAFLLLDGDELDDLHLPEAEVALGTAEPGNAAPATSAQWPVISLAEAEARTIKSALVHTGGDKTKAARVLDISRTALYEKLKRIEAAKPPDQP